MKAAIQSRHLLAVLGFAGFVSCAWFAYQCGRAAQASASSAYTAWLNGSAVFQPAARQNGLWLLAMCASAVIALVLLSTSLYRIRKAVLRIGLGLMLLIGSCLPVGFAVAILQPMLRSPGAPGPHVSSWSAGGITLEGRQMYAGAVFFVLLAVAIVAAGVYLLCSTRCEKNFDAPEDLERL